MHSYDSSTWLNFITIVQALNSQDFPLFNIRTSIGTNVKMINNRFFYHFQKQMGACGKINVHVYWDRDFIVWIIFALNVSHVICFLYIWIRLGTEW